MSEHPGDLSEVVRPPSVQSPKKLMEKAMMAGSLARWVSPDSVESQYEYTFRLSPAADKTRPLAPEAPLNKKKNSLLKF